jgi:hypothetical protein
MQEAEVSRLSAVEAAAERLRAQLAAADAAVGDKDSTLSLLLADKAYLSKEVQVSKCHLAPHAWLCDSILACGIDAAPHADIKFSDGLWACTCWLCWPAWLVCDMLLLAYLSMEVQVSVEKTWHQHAWLCDNISVCETDAATAAAMGSAMVSGAVPAGCTDQFGAYATSKECCCCCCCWCHCCCGY